MKKLLSAGLALLSIFIGTGCVEDPFYNPGDNYQNPTDLSYSEVVNSREFTRIRTAKPTVMTGGLVPTFEVVGVVDGAGNSLGSEYLSSVTVIQPILVEDIPLSESSYYVYEGDSIKTFDGINSREAGIIEIAEGNLFANGDYYFTIKVTSTTPDGQELSTTFDKGFHLLVGPQLPTGMLYVPMVQNLVIGGEPTSQAQKDGNTDVTFSLGSDTDKLAIDPTTGVLSLVDGYSVTDTETIIPKIIVTSNISGEETLFEGESVIKVITSNEPLTDLLQVDYINFFQPSFGQRLSTYGYSYQIIEMGNLYNSLVWKPGSYVNTFPGAVDNRPAATKTEYKSIECNITRGENMPHESWVVINPQDINFYNKLNFDLKATFYIQNKYVEYLADGKTPVDLLVKVSTDYTNNVNTASWIQVNDILTCSIANNADVTFTGTPYPGDQSGDDPENRKNAGTNADAKWVKCELDLSDYKDSNNFVLAFHLKPFFEGAIEAPGRPGRFYISDVTYTATVK